jgi:hypothetical protein
MAFVAEPPVLTPRCVSLLVLRARQATSAIASITHCLLDPRCGRPARGAKLSRELHRPMPRDAPVRPASAERRRAENRCPKGVEPRYVRYRTDEIDLLRLRSETA